jgi:hypothetical protein
MIAAQDWPIVAQHVVAVSGLVKDVFVPLLAAAVAAVGIALPLALVARNERIKFKVQREAEQGELERRRSQERSDKIAAAVQATHRDVLLLREFINFLALKRVQVPPEMVTDDETATLRDARERLFKGLYENSELFATLMPDEFQSGRRLEKLMLLLSVLESRLRSFEEEEEKRLDLMTMFGLNFLILAVDPKSQHTDTMEALKFIADKDPVARSLFDDLLVDVSGRLVTQSPSATSASDVP